MAGAIAHHFNNQLQVVLGNMEMAMVSPPLGADASALLEEALKAAHKAAQISGQMLTYRGQAPGKHALLDLSEICLQTLPILEAAAPKRVILKADFPSPGPVICANAGQIQQVLTNLVSNAFEAVGKNQGVIALTVKTVSRADIPFSKHFPIEWQPEDIFYGCLEVTDSGCGITENDIDKIFDPFFTTKFTGRGLGLPVVLGIVRTQHGAITVESNPGWGSIFRVLFPVSTEEAPRKPDKLSQPPKTECGATVLVVDDDEMVRNMSATMLRHLGFSVIEAKDGIEAVEIFRQHKDEIRCVLSDLTMPRMDGWETLAAMRELSPGIPVILSSGYDEAQVMAGKHTEHPNAFLGKPYQLKGLRETISRVLADQ
jgi:CheY-like chemotaxis protein